MTNPNPIVSRHPGFSSGDDGHPWGECYGTKRHLHESRQEPGLYDRDISDGPIERTAPAHNFHAGPSYVTFRTDQITLRHGNSALEVTLDAIGLTVDDTQVKLAPESVTVVRGTAKVIVSDDQIRAEIGSYSTIVARIDRISLTAPTLVYAMLLPKAAEVVRPGRLVALTADGVIEAGPGSSKIIGACHAEIDPDQVAVSLFLLPVSVEAAEPIVCADTISLDSEGRAIVAPAGSTTLLALNSARIGERIEVIRE